MFQLADIRIASNRRSRSGDCEKLLGLVAGVFALIIQDKKPCSACPASTKRLVAYIVLPTHAKTPAPHSQLSPSPAHKAAADAAVPRFAVALSYARPRWLDAVARSKLTRRGGPRTATHDAAQAERRGDGARSEHSEHAGHGSHRTRQGASMARSEVM